MLFKFTHFTLDSKSAFSHIIVTTGPPVTERPRKYVPVNQDSIQNTAITTPWGLYEYIEMPFELKNATQTFHRYNDHIFRSLDFVFVYIDDNMLMSEDEKQHGDHFQRVF